MELPQVAVIAPPAVVVQQTVPSAGLQPLIQAEQILIKQKKELLEAVTGIETNNKYDVLDANGRKIYTAEESSSWFSRILRGKQRCFKISLTDNNGMEVIKIERVYHCSGFPVGLSCMECCRDEVRVESPPGQFVGSVIQLHSFCRIYYAVRDAEDKIQLKIKGPHCCHCALPCADKKFKLTSADGDVEVGRISRKWTNLLQEMFTDADNFGISFPLDLHPNLKATVIGACFLIDFMFFESDGSKFND